MTANLSVARLGLAVRILSRGITYTKTPSQPSCMHSAASAGVAIPPAAKLTTGNLPVFATSRTSSMGAWFSFAKLYKSRSFMTVKLLMADMTALVCRTASMTLPVPASPLVRIIAAPSEILRRASPMSLQPQTKGTSIKKYDQSNGRQQGK